MGNSKFYVLLGLLVGAGSKLYIRTPFGILPMMDFAAYLVGPIVFITSFATYGKAVRRLLIMAFLWCVGSVVSDLYRGTPTMVMFKQAMILLDMFLLIPMSVWLLKKSPRFIFWFGVGAAFGAVISLYAFQNGALLAHAMSRGYDDSGSMTDFLAEKQYVPTYIGFGVCMVTYVPRILYRIPWCFVYSIRLAAGFYMLVNGGARNQFLTTVAGAGIIFLYANNKKLLNVIFKNKVIVLLVALMAALIFNQGYMFMAKNGYLGDEGLAKYERKKYGEASMLDSRVDLFVNWPFLWRSPIIGAGSEYIDRWGYTLKSKFVKDKKVSKKDSGVSRFYGHSVIIGSWTSAGIFGLLFWLYVLCMYVRFLGKDMYALGDLAPFMAAGIVSTLWDLFFSPFAGRGSYAMNVAFVALMQDPRFRGWMAMHWNKGFLRDNMRLLARRF